MFVDLPLEDLRAYRPTPAEPADFEDSWRATVDSARSRAQDPVLVPVDTPLTRLDTVDVTFSGYDGQPVKAWLRLPRGADRPLPCVVEYVGYGGGRGAVLDTTLWPLAGYAHLIMDSRGHSSAWGGADTPDVGGTGAPQSPGLLTRGIEDPSTHYYRRLVTDAVRALETARSLPAVDPVRVVVKGASQGGGLALATAGLAGLLGGPLAGALVDVPFLCGYRRATEITDAYPYREISDYLQFRSERVERVFATLAYVDGISFAARATAPSLFSTGLMDAVCPPSTVFAAFNAYAGSDKAIEVYPYGGHEAANGLHREHGLTFARRVAPPSP